MKAINLVSGSALLIQPIWAHGNHHAQSKADLEEKWGFDVSAYI
jgi:hypothetical protein